eukprot:6087207-Amphidinium_carterae.1
MDNVHFARPWHAKAVVEWLSKHPSEFASSRVRDIRAFLFLKKKCEDDEHMLHEKRATAIFTEVSNITFHWDDTLRVHHQFPLRQQSSRWTKSLIIRSRIGGRDGSTSGQSCRVEAFQAQRVSNACSSEEE